MCKIKIERVIEDYARAHPNYIINGVDIINGLTKPIPNYGNKTESIVNILKKTSEF